MNNISPANLRLLFVQGLRVLTLLDRFQVQALVTFLSFESGRLSEWSAFTPLLVLVGAVQHIRFNKTRGL